MHVCFLFCVCLICVCQCSLFKTQPHYVFCCRCLFVKHVFCQCSLFVRCSFFLSDHFSSRSMDVRFTFQKKVAQKRGLAPISVGEAIRFGVPPRSGFSSVVGTLLKLRLRRHLPRGFILVFHPVKLVSRYSVLGCSAASAQILKKLVLSIQKCRKYFCWS